MHGSTETRHVYRRAILFHRRWESPAEKEMFVAFRLRALRAGASNDGTTSKRQQHFCAIITDSMKRNAVMFHARSPALPDNLRESLGIIPRGNIQHP